MCILPRCRWLSDLADTTRSNQTTQTISLSDFENDCLCLCPNAAGVWFTAFNELIHVTPAADLNSTRSIHVPIDLGVHCGAIWFRTCQSP